MTIEKYIAKTTISTETCGHAMPLKFTIIKLR